MKAEPYLNLIVQREVREEQGAWGEQNVSVKCKCESSFESNAVGFTVPDTECLSNIFTQLEGSQDLTHISKCDMVATPSWNMTMYFSSTVALWFLWYTFSLLWRTTAKPDGHMVSESRKGSLGPEIKQIHSIIEWPGSEGTLQIIQSHRDTFH